MHGFYSRAELEQIATQILGERLDGRPKQDPYVQSEIQNYKIGSRLRTPDGITRHYCKAGAVGVPSSLERGAVSNVVPQTCGPGETYVGVIGAHLAGAYQVVIGDTVEAHGVDYWANGKVEIWTTIPQHRTIKSSTASNGTSVTLTLYYPLAYGITALTGLEICRSIYADVDGIGAADAQRKSCACIPMMIVSANYYFWGQTWGICTVGARHEGMGLAADSRQVYFNGINHAFQTEEEAGYVAGMQCVGYLLPDSSGGWQTAIMLQLDP